MSAVDELSRVDGIIPVTPQSVAELADEIRRLKGELLAIQKTNIWHIRAMVAEDEITRIKTWIRRIENVNDNPSRFHDDIDDYCRAALSGEPPRPEVTI